MSVIINATPLIALAVVDQLELLPQIFGDVIVPTTVYNEVVGQGLERPVRKSSPRPTGFRSCRRKLCPVLNRCY
jgi:predicted nucleic acid-binding protein